MATEAQGPTVEDPMMGTGDFGPNKKKTPLENEIQLLSFDFKSRGDEGLSVFRTTNRNDMIDFIQRETTNNIDLLKGLSIDRDQSVLLPRDQSIIPKDRKKWE